MLKAFIVLTICFNFLYASSDMQILQHANYLLGTKHTNNILRAYDEYRSLYVKAYNTKNIQLQRTSLNGIIKSGTLLHIDINLYKTKLRHLYAGSYSNHRALVWASWKKQYLVLKFNHNLTSRSIDYYKRHIKRYQYVLNINASMHYNRVFKKRGIDSIRLQRLNNHKISLVVTNKSPVKVNLYLKHNKIVISLAAKYTNKRAHRYSQQHQAHTYNRVAKSVSIRSIEDYSNIAYIADQHRIIVIDPGHGGKDPGTTGFMGYHEKNVVLAIGLKLYKILEQRGYTVYMTRKTDKFLTLRNRTRFANSKHADLFISIHANAVPYSERLEAHGIQTYFLALSDNARADRVAKQEDDVDMSDMNFYGKSAWATFITNSDRVSSNKLAINVESSVLRNLRKYYCGVADGGVRGGPFWVLVGAQMPSILIETGFMTYPKGAKRLVNPLYQQRLAVGIANGIDAYFLMRDR